MSTIKLSYSTFGLTRLSIIDAIREVAKAGYPGIELAFHRDNFNPYLINNALLDQIKSELQANSIFPACISSPTYFFMNERPHEPSLMSIDLAGRKQRIDLIKRAIKVAQYLGSPLVCFGSGFIREEHMNNPKVNPRELLVASIRECLQDIDDVTLVIEPEPGMFIETIDDGVSLVNEIGSENFKLHLDLNHVSCGDHEYETKIAQAAPLTCYLHISDTVDGYNLKMSLATEDIDYDLSITNHLIYFPKKADFLLVDKQHSIYFYDSPLTTQEKQEIEHLATSINQVEVKYVDYNGLLNSPSIYDPEFSVYGFSIQRLSFYIVDRAKPILRYLRENGIADKMIANTLTGKVHFHEIPGKGEVNFKRCFDLLVANGFTGYGSVELYHHIDRWQEALVESLSYLEQFLPKKEEACA